MDRNDKPDVKISEYCEKHDTNKIVAWCSTHNIGVCIVCQKMDHSECNSIESMSEVPSATELNAEFKTWKRKFAGVKKIYKTLQQERKSNVESLKSQKIQIRDKIRNLRENLNNHLIELERKLINELDRTCRKYTLKLEEEISDYEYRNAVLERYDDDSAKAKEYGTNLQITLAAKEGVAMASREEQYLTNLNKIIKNYSVELKIADAITDILNISSMGKIETVEANAYVDIEILNRKSFLPTIKVQKTKTTLVHKEEFRWDRTRLKYSKEFNMNTSLDKFLPEVTGAVFMPDQSILLADAAHKRLLHLKDRGQIYQEISLSFVPFDVGVLGNSKLYISMANDRRIDVRDINSMEPIDELILPTKVSGINGYEDKLLVVACEKTGLYLFGSDNSVNIIQMRHNEEGPVDINADTICCAETKKCLVHSFTYNGKRKFTVKVEGFGYIHGVALLKDGSILVAKLSPGKHSVIHISRDGKEKMFRLELNEIAAPRSFAVHQKTRKILLVHGVRKISIFKEV